ncbi:MAG TPA: hypothetical protein VGQ18_07720 [Gemmatimonadales bacterium]|jgi:hypothetical protein|nr:hypothetical protein [Gemmatimonadales bacterium]
MILALALLTQTATLAAARTPAPTATPIRVWRTDSTVAVSLKDPGYVTLLHVSADGRISVLFPLEPGLDTWVPAETPLQMSLPPRAQGSAATFVAITSRWPFDFAALSAGTGAGSTWDYGRAWLLQPTAGDPLAALLDIADRVTDGRPYDYGTAAYENGGTVANRRTPRQPDVCLSCVRHGAPVAAAPAALATNAVDCANASLTNSFCGVNSGSVSIAAPPAPTQVVYQPAPPAPTAVYVPYFVPVTQGFHQRFMPPSPAPAAPAQAMSQGVAYPIAPRLIVPSSTQIHTFTTRRP